MKFAARLTVIVFFVSSICLAQVRLVKDITQGPNVPTADSAPQNFCEYKGEVYFSASSWSTGVELFKTDGTASGTKLVLDLNPGESNGNPRMLTVIGDKLYFTGVDTNGEFLGITDGTNAGTTRIYKGNPYSGLGTRSFLASGNYVYFSGFDFDHGREMWRTDGTPAGTIMLKDINPGANSSSGDSRHVYAEINGEVIFAATDGVSGMELWKTDGTPAGTILIGDLRTGAANFVGNPDTFLGFVAYNDRLYFVGNDGVHGNELWSTNGTQPGTTVITDDTGNVESVVRSWNNGVIYTRTGIGVMQRYFISDGTIPGTYPLSNTINNISGPMREFNDELYFLGKDDAGKWSLWKTDGTVAGTLVVKEIDVDNLLALTMTDDLIYFFGHDYSETEQQLWISDGTPSGTSMLTHMSNPYRQTIGALGKLFFCGDHAVWGDELAVSDGTTNGTKFVTDINTESSIFILYTTSVNNTVVFTTNDIMHGQELWRTDGTEAGTVLVKDIYPGSTGSSIAAVTKLNDLVVFSADDGIHGPELWRSDGTEAGTYLVKDILPGTDGSWPYTAGFVRMGNHVYFNTGNQLWRTDGTAAGTTMVNNNGFFPNSLAASATSLYFLHGTELWKSDGTQAGTLLIKDLKAVQVGSFGAGMITTGNTLTYLIADDGAHGMELWVSDGTSTGTKMVKDIHPGSDAHYTSILGVINDIAYFQASAVNFDYELWRSDGTEAGTYKVKDINSGPLGSTPRFLHVDGTAFYFHADDGIHGGEIWKSDGTESGTVLFKDANPGVKSSDPSNFASFNNKLYFNANDGSRYTLWQTDGTATGTKVVNNFLPDVNPFRVSGPGAHLNKLFFVGQDNAHDRELWVFDPMFQKINVEPVADKTYGDSAFNISATATSGLPVQFSVVSGPATINGNNVTLTGAGSVSILATQPGNNEFNSAEPVTINFVVAKASQSIVFAEIPAKTFNDSHTLTATASSPLPVTFTVVSGTATLTGNTIKFTAAGTVVVRASQNGNDNYLTATSIERTIEVKKADQTIGDIILTVVNTGGDGTGGGSLATTASSGLPVVFTVVSGSATIQSGTNLVATGNAGETTSIVVRASQTGNQNYNSVSKDQTFIITLILAVEPDAPGISVFPNPATSTIVVTLPPSSSFNALTLQDVLGRDVISMEVMQQEIEVDVEKFPRGVYLVRLSGGEKLVFNKRVILK